MKEHPKHHPKKQQPGGARGERPAAPAAPAPAQPAQRAQRTQGQQRAWMGLVLVLVLVLVEEVGGVVEREES
jgi:hypothetical protein